jgi:hypothetical protein
MVQKGKFSAGIDNFVTMLKKVDLPTLGNPTIPILRWEEKRPRMGRSAGAASFFALGGLGLGSAAARWLLGRNLGVG